MDVSVIETQTDRVINVLELLNEAERKNKWLVAHKSAQYQLRVGAYSLDMEMSDQAEFDVVLSHRWKPALKTTNFGDVPVPMMTATFDEPTWIDFINHFNNDHHTKRVMQCMGGLYAEKRCRALYFEGETRFETQLEASLRGWMWQEICLGPQDHKYNSSTANVLHFVVSVGEFEALRATNELMRATLTVSELALSQRQGRLTLQMWLLGKLVQVCRRIVYFHMSVEAIDWEEQRLEDVLCRCLSLLRHSPLPVGSPTGRRDEIMALITGLISDENVPRHGTLSERMTGVAQLLVGLSCTMMRCLVRVYEARSSSREESMRVGLLCWRRGLAVLGALQGSLAPSDALTGTALAALRLRLRFTQTSSAVANLRNKNLQKPADRLPASFAVLCALRGVTWEPESPAMGGRIAELVLAEQEVRVSCLPASDTCGIAAVARKRVGLTLHGYRTAGWLSNLLMLALTWKPCLAGEWDTVALRRGDPRGGAAGQQRPLVVSGCAVKVVVSWSSLWRVLWAGVSDLAGEVRMYTLRDGSLVELTVMLDGGTVVHCGGFGQSEAMPVPRLAPCREFIAWYDGR